MTAYKLMRRKADGSVTPLFINKHQVIPLGEWLEAECHPTPGFAVRPGWHVTPRPYAPHLTTKGRVWAKVEVRDVTEHPRPECQGGMWYLAKWMLVVELIEDPSLELQEA